MLVLFDSYIFQEIRELYRKMDHDQKLQDFMSVKCQVRIMVDLESKEMEKREKQREEMTEQIRKYEEILYNIFVSPVSMTKQQVTFFSRRPLQDIITSTP